MVTGNHAGVSLTRQLIRDVRDNADAQSAKYAALSASHETLARSCEVALSSVHGADPKTCAVCAARRIIVDALKSGMVTL